MEVCIEDKNLPCWEAVRNMSENRGFLSKEAIDTYQKLSKFCPIKDDVAELSKKIELLFTNFAARVETIEGKIDGITSMVIEQKVMESEVKHLNNRINRIQEDYHDLKEIRKEIITKKDIAIYLTGMTIVVILISAVIPVLFK